LQNLWLLVKGYPIPTPLQLQSIQPPLSLPLPLPPFLPSPQLSAEQAPKDQIETDSPAAVDPIDTPVINIEQVDVYVDPEVVYLIKITNETNTIAAANVSNRNDELKESGNSLNKSVLELNIAEQVVLPSGSNLESIDIIQIKPALNDYGS
jgi:hypothetical protein